MRHLLFAALFLACALAAPARAESDQPGQLPSWREGPVRTAITGFVTRVSTPGTADYVPPAERIAVFDNDGTLWAEQPLYTQALFAFDRIRELAPDHPEWQTEEPFKSVLGGDLAAVAAQGEAGLLQLVLASHTGVSADEFNRVAKEWLLTRMHPKLDRPYFQTVYQPQIELIDYLHRHDFRVFIVSGGGTAFIRPVSRSLYDIAPERVVGSRIDTEYRVIDGVPTLIRVPNLGFVNDKAGKPVGIYEHIGQRPILAFGNSDGDFEMVEYTTAGTGPRLGLFLRHTDDEREFAYDRDSPVGRLDRALTEAPERGWIVVDMARDWDRVFPPISR